MGGIGEVCTHVDYRRQGIASALLNNAFDQMNAKKMDCTLLHVSNPSLQVVCQKQGYISVLRPWSLMMKYFGKRRKFKIIIFFSSAQ